MLTRRELLQQTLLIPFASLGASAQLLSGSEIMCGPDCLSQESARGFRSAGIPPGIIVVCGASENMRAEELHRRAMNGEWIIWEASPSMPERCSEMTKLFGIQPRSQVTGEFYIRYIRPLGGLTRSFLSALSIHCGPDEILALHGETPVAMKRRIGRGGVVFLGSMLGPNLHAEEPEAHRITKALFENLRSG